MTGSLIYRKTQIAWPTIVPLAITAGVIVPIFLRTELTAGLWIFGVVWAAALLLFATLTVTVTSDGVQAAFGPGLVRKTLMLGDVVSFAPVRNSWRHGWGIHYYPGGVVYNAAGFDAVEFKMANGRFVRLGTAEPEAFAAAVAQGSGRAPSVHEPYAGSVLMARHVVGIIAGVAAVSVAGWVMYSGFQPPVVAVADDSFSVSNGFYRNTVRYDTIRTVSLESGLPRVGLKTNGFAARSVLRGSFRVDTWGTSRLYVDLNVPPFVVVQSGDTHIAVSFAEPEKTRKLYADLKSHLARSRR